VLGETCFQGLEGRFQDCIQVGGTKVRLVHALGEAEFANAIKTAKAKAIEQCFAGLVDGFCEGEIGRRRSLDVELPRLTEVVAAIVCCNFLSCGEGKGRPGIGELNVIVLHVQLRLR